MKTKIYLFVLISCVFSINAARAATINVTLPVGNTNWNSALLGSPTSQDDVIIIPAEGGSILTINTAAVCKSLTIGNSGNVSKGTFTLTISGANSLSVAGLLNLYQGTEDSYNRSISISAGTLTVGSITIGSTVKANSASITMTTGLMQILGGWAMGTSTSFTAGSGTVEYSGTNQSIPGYTYNNLTISGGGSKTLASATTINGTLTLTSGYLVTDSVGSKTLTLSSTGSVSGGSANSFIIGPLTKTNIASGASFTFPVGAYDATKTAYMYRPVVLSNPSSATNSFTVTSYRQNPYDKVGNVLNTQTANYTLQNISTVEYWDIKRNTGTVTVDVTLNWDGYTVATLDLMMAHYNSTTSKWERSTGTRGTPVSSTPKTITYTTVSSFSPFTIGSIGALALPVTLTNFSVKAGLNNTVNLAWGTSAEIVNKGFTIERQTNNANGKFEHIGFVASKAPGGNSQTPLYYSFTDEMPSASATNFYRLAQHDLDGKISYSEVRSVKLGKETVTMLFPNPSNGALNISRTNNGKKMNIIVVDQSGRVITQVNNITEPTYKLNNLRPGVYNIKMSYPETGEQSVQKVVVQK